MKLDWYKIADELRTWAAMPELGWKLGQEDSLRWLADRIGMAHGLLLADEVGLGKTRLAIALMHAVRNAGGNVLVVAPATLLHQWDAEHTRFLGAFGKSAARASNANYRHLRHFNDLFQDGCRYPLSSQHPFILVSHNFGIPQRIGASSHPESWALPFIVRSFSQHGIDKWSGARWLNNASKKRPLEAQLPAARWLANKGLGSTLAAAGLPPLNKLAGAAFSIDGGNSARQLRRLLQTLVGKLMGSFDLIVIDEAHRSREDLSDDKAPAKRLTSLLQDIVNSKPNARKLALTATPLQLAASDWSMTLQRIGIREGDLKRRSQAIERFDAACAAHRAGPATEADVDALCRASKEFQDALSDVVVRRRWSDQPIIKKARLAFGDGGAHPQRCWKQNVLTWVSLGEADRMAFLAAEGRSLASVGTSLDLVERHRAARHAQAMDEIDLIETTSMDAAEDLPALSIDVPRHAYWTSLHNTLRSRYAADGYGGLIRHPRIVEACSWIESVTDAHDGKVLVFANYTRPLLALSKVLNVRRFLRDVASGKPTLPPLALGSSDVHAHPLIGEVLASMLDRDAIERSGNLANLISSSTKRYRKESDDLAVQLRKVPEFRCLEAPERTIIRLAALEWLLWKRPNKVELMDKIVQLAEMLAVAPTKVGKKSPVNGLVDTLIAEQETSVLSRSEFSREFYGKTAAATKHIVQALFNDPLLRPQVLVAQTRVAAEGLNLHEACRHVLFLHLDWNPATIEQQIGRVDRVGSLWAREFESTIDGRRPRIELATIVIEGTSDADRQSRIIARQHLLGSHLFGELLPPEIMRGLSLEWQARLKAASPSFSPLGN